MPPATSPTPEATSPAPEARPSAPAFSSPTPSPSWRNPDTSSVVSGISMPMENGTAAKLMPLIEKPLT